MTSKLRPAPVRIAVHVILQRVDDAGKATRVRLCLESGQMRTVCLEDVTAAIQVDHLAPPTVDYQFARLIVDSVLAQVWAAGVAALSAGPSGQRVAAEIASVPWQEV